MRQSSVGVHNVQHRLYWTIQCDASKREPAVRRTQNSRARSRSGSVHEGEEVQNVVLADGQRTPGSSPVAASLSTLRPYLAGQRASVARRMSTWRRIAPNLQAVQRVSDHDPRVQVGDLSRRPRDERERTSCLYTAGVYSSRGCGECCFVCKHRYLPSSRMTASARIFPREPLSSFPCFSLNDVILSR